MRSIVRTGQAVRWFGAAARTAVSVASMVHLWLYMLLFGGQVLLLRYRWPLARAVNRWGLSWELPLKLGRQPRTPQEWGRRLNRYGGRFRRRGKRLLQQLAFLMGILLSFAMPPIAPLLPGGFRLLPPLLFSLASILAYQRYYWEAQHFWQFLLMPQVPRLARQAARASGADGQPAVLAHAIPAQAPWPEHYCLAAQWLMEGYEPAPQALARLRAAERPRYIFGDHPHPTYPEQLQALEQQQPTLIRYIMAALLGAPQERSQRAALRRFGVWLERDGAEAQAKLYRTALRLAAPAARQPLLALAASYPLMDERQLRAWLHAEEELLQQLALQLAQVQRMPQLAGATVELLSAGRLQAVQAGLDYLSQQGNEAAIAKLQPRFQQTDLPPERYAAIGQALVSLQLPDLKDPLAWGLYHEAAAYYEPALALAAQAAQYDPAVAELVRSYLHTRQVPEGRRLALLRTLSKTEQAGAFVDTIEGLLAGGSETELGSEALRTLRQLAPQRYFSRLADVLASRDEQLRLEGVQQIAQVSDIRFAQQLDQRLQALNADTLTAWDQKEREFQLIYRTLRALLSAHEPPTEVPAQAYCTACYRYAVPFKLSMVEATYWACPLCRDTLDLAALNGPVIGHVGDDLAAPVHRADGYHLPLWDATQRQATAAQVDTLWLYNSALTEPEWAVSAVLQALEQAAPGAEAAPRVWVAAPQALPLNAQKMLATWTGTALTSRA